MDQDPKDYWQVLDIDTGGVQRIPTLINLPGSGANAIATNADDTAIVAANPSGDLVRIIEVPRKGGLAKELLSTLMPDGRILFPVQLEGRNRLLVARAGQNPAPFVQTSEETAGPVAMVGKSDLAFLLGPMRVLAIASVADGRIARRLETAHGAAIEGLAALPDGKTLYYAAAGKIWSIPSMGGKPEIVRDGEGVAVDSRGEYLIIQLNENNNVRFVRFPLKGGQDQPLTFSEVRPATTRIAANAVGVNGIIVKNANYSDSWPWNLALLNPATGKSQRIILPSLDVQSASWTPSGQIAVLAARTSSSIWRMRPMVR